MVKLEIPLHIAADLVDVLRDVNIPRFESVIDTLQAALLADDRLTIVEDAPLGDRIAIVEDDPFEGCEEYGYTPAEDSALDGYYESLTELSE